MKFSPALRITFLYALIGGLWILLSDKLIAFVFASPAQLIAAQMYKGWFYVLITSLFLYELINKYLDRQKSLTKDYINVFEYAEEGIFRSTSGGHFLMVNPAFAKMYGYSSPKELMEEVTNISTQIHVSAETRRNFIEKLVTQGSIQKFEALNYRRDGSVIWTSTNARVVKDKHGEILYYEGFVRDITAEKNAQEAVALSEARYHMLVEQASDGIFITDINGKILEANQQACAMLKYSRDEFLNSSVRQFISEEDLTFRPLNFKDISSRQVIVSERTFVKKDNSFITVELTTKILPDGNLMLMARDVSTRKLMQETLLRSERRVRTLIDNNIDAIVLYGEDNKILFQNPAASRILGYQQQDMIGKNLFSLVYEADIEKANRGLKSILEEPGKSKIFEIRFMHKNGDIRWLEIIGTSKLNDPEIEAVIINFRDITTRKQVETALLETEEQYRLLVEKLPAVVFMDVFNDPNQTQYISPRMEDLLGYTPQEWMLGFNLWENSLHPEDKERVLAEDSRTDQSGEPFRIEYRLRHKNGHYIWVKEDASIIYDENGNPLYWHGILLDITERKKIEEAQQRQLKELTVLHAVSQAESISMSADELLKRVTDIIADTLYSDNCGVLIFDPSNNSLAPHYSYRDTSTENIRTTLPVSRGITGKVASSHKTFRDGNVTSNPDYVKVKEGVHSELCVPILHGEKLFGVLNVESDRLNAFTEDDERLLNTIANGIAVSIERLKLFDAEQKRRIQEETLREAEKALTSSLELFEVYQIILDSVYKLVPYTSASIEVIDGEYLEIVAQRGIPNGQSYIGIRYLLEPGKWGNSIWETIIIPDVQQDARFTKLPGTEYIHGWMGIPLITENKILGYINLDSDQVDFFKKEHAFVLRAFGNHASIAMEKARLFQEEQKRRQEAENLRLAAAAITSTLDINNILYEIIKALRQVTPYDSASIILQEGDWLRVAVTQDISNADEIANIRYPITDDELFQHIKKTKQPLILRSPLNDSRFRNWGNYTSIQSWMAIPLIMRGEVVGCITLDSKLANTYNEDIGNRAMLFAHQAAIAMENARLYTETRSRLEELEMVSRISSALRAARDTKEMFPILLNEIKASMGTENAAIWIFNPEQKELIPQAVSGWMGRLPKHRFGPNEGIIGKVFASGNIHISNELFDDSELQLEDTNVVKNNWGGITVPIRTATEVIGVITVAIQSPRKIEANHIRLITTIAEIAGNAIHRSNLYERSEEQIRRLTTLREIDTAIASSVDLHITLSILTEHITTKMGTSAAAVLVFDNESQSLEYRAASGFQSREFTRIPVEIGDGLAGKVLLARQPTHIKELASELGAQKYSSTFTEKFASYYAIPLFSKGIARGILETYFRHPFSPTADWLDFIHALAEQATIAIENAHLVENLQRTNQEISLAYDTTLEGWGKALELRDKETEGHTRRVTDLTLKLARRMGIPNSELIHIRRGALLHDIGKMGVPDHILRKGGPFTQEEKDEMQKHPVYAYELLFPIPYLRPAVDIAYCHHEWWNGQGYPRGLQGEEIPLSARIFAVVDVWDALRSDRPYRKAWTRKRTIDYIRGLAGKQFDPHIVDIFMEMIEEQDQGLEREK